MLTCPHKGFPFFHCCSSSLHRPNDNFPPSPLPSKAFFPQVLSQSRNLPPLTEYQTISRPFSKNFLLLLKLTKIFCLSPHFTNALSLITTSEVLNLQSKSFHSSPLHSDFPLPILQAFSPLTQKHFFFISESPLLPSLKVFTPSPPF